MMNERIKDQDGDSTMSDYKREVVESAIQGLIQGGMSEPEAHNLKNLLEVVYQCGYNEAVRDPAVQLISARANLRDVLANVDNEGV